MGMSCHVGIITLVMGLLLSAQVAIAATHATRGVVKSVDDTTLVIVRFAHRGEMTFRVSASTRRDGVIAPGVTVSVRCVVEGQTNVATAVAVQQPGGPQRPQEDRTPIM